MEYNRYQEENTTDETIERFGDDQGVADLPSFDRRKTNKTNDDDDDRNHPPSTTTDDYYYSGTEDKQPPTKLNDSYL